jgi:hypothetical protein
MSLDFARDREPVERQGGARRAEVPTGGGSPTAGGSEAYSGYAAASAPACRVPIRRMGTPQMAFLSSLLNVSGTFFPGRGSVAGRPSQTSGETNPRGNGQDGFC